MTLVDIDFEEEANSSTLYDREENKVKIYISSHGVIFNISLSLFEASKLLTELDFTVKDSIQRMEAKK